MCYSSPLPFLGFHALPRFFVVTYHILGLQSQLTERFVLRIGVTLDSLDAKDIYDPSTMSARQRADSPHRSKKSSSNRGLPASSSIQMWQFWVPRMALDSWTISGKICPNVSKNFDPYGPRATGSYRKSWSKWSTSWTRRSSHWAGVQFHTWFLGDTFGLKLAVNTC